MADIPGDPRFIEGEPLSMLELARQADLAGRVEHVSVLGSMGASGGTGPGGVSISVPGEPRWRVWITGKDPNPSNPQYLYSWECVRRTSDGAGWETDDSGPAGAYNTTPLREVNENGSVPDFTIVEAWLGDDGQSLYFYYEGNGSGGDTASITVANDTASVTLTATKLVIDGSGPTGLTLHDDGSGVARVGLTLAAQNVPGVISADSGTDLSTFTGLPSAQMLGRGPKRFPEYLHLNYGLFWDTTNTTNYTPGTEASGAAYGAIIPTYLGDLGDAYPNHLQALTITLKPDSHFSSGGESYHGSSITLDLANNNGVLINTGGGDAVRVNKTKLALLQSGAKFSVNGNDGIGTATGGKTFVGGIMTGGDFSIATAKVYVTDAFVSGGAAYGYQICYNNIYTGLSLDTHIYDTDALHIYDTSSGGLGGYLKVPAGKDGWWLLFATYYNECDLGTIYGDWGIAVNGSYAIAELTNVSRISELVTVAQLSVGDVIQILVKPVNFASSDTPHLRVSGALYPTLGAVYLGKV